MVTKEKLLTEWMLVYHLSKECNDSNFLTLCNKEVLEQYMISLGKELLVPPGWTPLFVWLQW
jgi:hypothetical protein